VSVPATPMPGFVEWFRPGWTGHAEAVIREMRDAGVTRLRTQLSWADWHAPGGPEWCDWLLPRLAPFELTLCAHYTPPSISRNGRSSGPPLRLADYADFIDVALTRYGDHVDVVELWNEPNNLLDWDWRIDPDHALFSEMVGAAGYWAAQRGFRTLLGGPCPFDPVFLEQMGRHGVLGVVSAVGLHGFPGTWDSAAGGWRGWPAIIGEAREVLGRWKEGLEVWISEAGFSTWRHDAIEQVRRFVEFRAAPADRHYWYSWRDIDPAVAVQDGAWFDPRHYHLGAVDAAGRPKLLARLLVDVDPGKMERVVALAAPPLRRAAARPVAVIGGCGFIGANLADSWLADGDEVVAIDNLSRPGVEENLAWLRDGHGRRLRAGIVDIRDRRLLARALEGARAVFHMAAQTAVTTSLADPEQDFEINARGTLNVVAAMRAAAPDAPLVYASTNKVYGDLSGLALGPLGDRLAPRDRQIGARGVDETWPLQLLTPYGCSKGVADQYVLDAAASGWLKTAVLRMSCIYGPRQFGTEDQGWVAHILLRALADREITIFGDGRQVRDILHVSDAVAAYRALLDRIDAVNGRAFNLGGGPSNAVSLLSFLDEAGRLSGRRPRVRTEPTRQGDQGYFVADTALLSAATDWRARVPWRDGVAGLADWLMRHRLPVEAAAPRAATA
jgi:CDP-paratose 2-epimerase